MRYYSYFGAIKGVFIKTSGGIILFFALAKLVSVFFPGGRADAIDEILFIKNKHVFLLIGLLELAVSAWLLVSSKPQVSKLLAIFWLSSMFFVYRIGLSLMHVVKLCACLGGLVGWYPWLAPYLAIFIKCSLCFLLLGSLALLLANLYVTDSHLAKAEIK